MKKRFIYPPRPEHTPVPFNNTASYRSYGWVCQLKYNDKHIVVSTEGDTVELFNRQGNAPTYRLSATLHDEIVAVVSRVGHDLAKWSYFDGGLLHGKNRNISDTLVLWDVLVRDGEWLLDTTYSERYRSLLASSEPFLLELGGEQFDLGVKLSEHIFVPRTYTDFSEAWDFVQRVNAAAGWAGGGEPLLEGIVIKNPSGQLQPGFKEKNNTTWSARSRITTGRHRF